MSLQFKEKIDLLLKSIKETTEAAREVSREIGAIPQVLGSDVMVDLVGGGVELNWRTREEEFHPVIAAEDLKGLSTHFRDFHLTSEDLLNALLGQEAFKVYSLNFYPEFSQDIRAGRKTLTTRSSTMAEVGGNLQLLEKDRLGNPKLIKKAICTGVLPIKITQSGATYTEWGGNPQIFEAEGFNSHEAYIKFIKKRYGLPFQGVLINWG